MPRYQPPANVALLTLNELLQGRRSLEDHEQRRLKIADTPVAGPALWCAGDARLVQWPCVAIVGTREVSPHGAARARRLARDLVRQQIVVVSGLARGVDTEALRAAIEAGGRVIAVIGTPIDRAYPAENAALQEQIYRDHLLVSQFEPGSRVYPSNFPERNKLMAALTDATVIVEAGDSSGTLHQAAECVRLGRPLFVAESLFHNDRVTWPKRFVHEEGVHALRIAGDVVEMVRG